MGQRFKEMVLPDFLCNIEQMLVLTKYAIVVAAHKFTRS